MDTLTPERRSANMRAIAGRNTAPERAVRSCLHALGYRFRVGGKGILGRPDIVFPARGKVIFVHGCFWHRHPGCKKAYTPKSREAFWSEKFAGNVKRDERVIAELIENDWSVLVVWECEANDLPSLERTLVRFLGPTRSSCRDNHE